jgi:LacI family transcriptional regulator
MRPKKKVSQQRIARDLGISQALVSLALNGRKDGINPETYTAIWEHALGLGYEPKGMVLAQSPAEARQKQVGFILRAGLTIHNQGSYFGLVLHGLHTALAAKGYAAVFIGAEDTLDRPRLEAFFPTGHSLKGVVMMGEVAPAFLKDLRRYERRLVAVSARHPGLCHSVIGNEAQSLDLLVDHLHGLGHRRFGWLGGNVGLNRHQMRYDAFREALRRHQLSFQDRYSVQLAQGDRAEGGDAILSLLPQAKRKDFPTAFVCYNTLMAAGATKALLREKWRVPGDFSVAGADNSALAASESPRITVAGCDAEKLGATAARIILDSTGTDDESFNDLILPSQLLPGETTGPAPA